MNFGKASGISRRLFLIAGTLVPGAASPRTTEAQARSESSPALLHAVMHALAKVPRSEARFREVKRFAQLTKPLISYGRLIYVRPQYLAMMTEVPHREKLVVDADRLYLAEGDAAAHVIDLAARPAIKVLIDAIRGALAGDVGALQKLFSVNATGTPARWRLSLAPRAPAAARLLRTLAFEGEGSSVRRLTVVEANGDEMDLSIGPPL